MPNLIEWIDSVGTSGKKFDFSDPDVAKSYVPFSINMGLSQNMDTVLFANEMNKRPWLEPELQYNFYLKSITKKKRYSKWGKIVKLDNQEDIDMVSKFYEVNNQKATEYIKLLQPQELEYIKSRLVEGGCVTPRKKKV